MCSRSLLLQPVVILLAIEAVGDRAGAAEHRAGEAGGFHGWELVRRQQLDRLIANPLRFAASFSSGISP